MGPPICTVVAVFMLTASGCTKTAHVPAGLEGSGAFSNSPPAGPGRPCNLLTTEEVQLALNAPTIGSGQQGSRPLLAGMDICRVNTPGGLWLSWGVASKATRAFDTYKKVNQDWIEETEVAGNQAIWDQELRTLIVLEGRRAFAVKVSVTRAALEKGTDPQAYAKQTASRLAFRGLDRL